jgi:hypothetical protein
MRYTTVSAIGAGTAYPFGEHMFISVRVVQSLVLCEVFCEPLFVLFQSSLLFLLITILESSNL